MSETDVILDSINDVRKHQERLEDKIDDLRELVVMNTGRVELCEEKIRKSILIPNWILFFFK